MPATVDPVGQFVFYLFALTALASALLFVTRRSPVSAALWLVSTMFSIAGIYILLDAHFVGAVQVLVYAGAIMVVFLFVVMLLNLGEGDAAGDVRKSRTRLAAGAVGVALLAELLVLLKVPLPSAMAVEARGASATGDVNVVAPVARALFADYLVAFEVTSLLLLASVVGAVVLAKRRERA